MNFLKTILKNVPAIWVVCLMLGLVAPSLMMDGMFIDAEQYSAVSHNMASGVGSFWFPHFTLQNVGGLDYFLEHPPLVFGLQASFFVLFGDSIFTERIFTLITFLLSAVLIVIIWKRLVPQYSIGFWFPLLLWINMPVVFWSFRQNMLENMMGIFILLAVWLAFESMNNKRLPWMILLAGLGVFLATFSKELPGLFPIAAPIIYSIS